MIDNHADELRRTLTELGNARLRPDAWRHVAAHVSDIEAGVYDAPLRELSQLLFEAKVRGRFQGRRRDVTIEPTKQTSVLPVVGLVCAGVLVAVGALLGGGVILVGIVALGVFVFGVAVAGSHVRSRGRGDSVIDLTDDVEPMPPALWTRIQRLRTSEHLAI